jgi:hypothetical protein
MPLNSESLSYWYFRLNGFFTIPHFVVHPDLGDQQRTEVDVLGVRLPFRQELLLDPMRDDDLFTRMGNKAFLAIAEVKTDLIKFNATWRDRTLSNVERFLGAAGAFPTDRISGIASAIYDHGCFDADDHFHVSLVGIGRRQNTDLLKQCPGVPQITWDHIASFVFDRFNRYRNQKKWHDQWDDAGHELWGLWVPLSGDEAAFRNAIRVVVDKNR